MALSKRQQSTPVTSLNDTPQEDVRWSTNPQTVKGPSVKAWENKVEASAPVKGPAPVEASAPWNSQLLQHTIGSSTTGDINILFDRSYKNFLRSYQVKYPMSSEETKEPSDRFIFTGLKINDNILFGDLVNSADDGQNCTDINNSYHRKVVQMFKLYIMSIISNYPYKGTTSHQLINAEINNGKKFNLQAVKDILDVPVIQPPAIPPVKPSRPPMSSDDSLELQIYREFGVKCPSDHACMTYDGKYYANYKKLFPNFVFNDKNKTEPDLGDIIERRGRGNVEFNPDIQLRNLYVNIEEYITGNEGATAGFNKFIKFYKITVALRYIKKYTETDLFYGINIKEPLKPLIIDMNKLIDIVRSLRERVIERQGLKPNPEYTIGPLNYQTPR